jgi:Spy/CpxP family protein refolding chaperone
MNRETRPPFLIIVAVFLAALAGGVLGCGIGMKWMKHCFHQDPSLEWLHRELQITPSQEPKVTEIEKRFQAREKALKDNLAAANRKLGTAIEEDQSFTPRVAQAVEETHLAMAELQKASLERVFAMKESLTPEQYRRLLELARQALGGE